MSSEIPHHIVMLPYLARGHLNPFLQLAKQIEQRTSFKITIATTPLNINYLRSTISSSPSSRINFSELAFCSSDHGLPPNVENTENLPLSKIADLFNASTSLEAPTRKLVEEITRNENKPPLCLISDVFFGWANDVANILGTNNFTFTTGGAYGTLAYISVWLNLPHRFTTTEEFSLPWFPERCRFHVSQLHQYIRSANGEDQWSIFMQTQILKSLKSHGWLVNTVEEIEPFGLEIFRNFIKIPVWSIGSVLSQFDIKNSKSSTISSSLLGISAEECLKWLDLQKPNSVIYISFGSQNTISQTQMMELAMGLEKSEKAFIWVIRPPYGFDLKGEFKAEWLPSGFEERLMNKGKRGILVKNWAPQMEILSHKAIAVFLSHCGWNSIMESLGQGVPVIGWPLAAEQAYNSKMLMEEMGVSLELTTGVSGSVSAEKVKDLIDLVMDENGKGGEMRKKACKVKELMRDALKEKGEDRGSSAKAMDDFLATVLLMRKDLSN